MEKTSNKIWFRRKRYGLGWFPVSWQGWIVILVYVLLMVRVTIESNNAHSGSDALFAFAVPFVLFTTALIIVCYHKGEEPKWQWGKNKR